MLLDRTSTAPRRRCTMRWGAAFCGVCSSVRPAFSLPSQLWTGSSTRIYCGLSTQAVLKFRYGNGRLMIAGRALLYVSLSVIESFIMVLTRLQFFKLCVNPKRAIEPAIDSSTLLSTMHSSREYRCRNFHVFCVLCFVFCVHFFFSLFLVHGSLAEC